MNLEGQKQLLEYMTRPPSEMSNTELDSYLWLLEQKLQECQEHLLGRRPPWELDDPNT